MQLIQKRTMELIKKHSPSKCHECDDTTIHSLCVNLGCLGYLCINCALAHSLSLSHHVVQISSTVFNLQVLSRDELFISQQNDISTKLYTSLQMLSHLQSFSISLPIICSHGNTLTRTILTLVSRQWLGLQNLSISIPNASILEQSSMHGFASLFLHPSLQTIRISIKRILEEQSRPLLNSFINGFDSLQSPMQGSLEIELLSDNQKPWNSSDLTERLLSSLGKFKALTRLNISIPGEIRSELAMTIIMKNIEQLQSLCACNIQLSTIKSLINENKTISTLISNSLNTSNFSNLRQFSISERTQDLEQQILNREISLKSKFLTIPPTKPPQNALNAYFQQKRNLIQSLHLLNSLQQKLQIRKDILSEIVLLYYI